jgi:hypothetical protein
MKVTYNVFCKITNEGVILMSMFMVLVPIAPKI